MNMQDDLAAKPARTLECCSTCSKPFPHRRRNPKTSLCRHCWSVKALALRRVAA